MKTITFQGSKITVPETLRGKALRSLCNVPETRSMYVTDLDGKNSIIKDGDTIAIRNVAEVGELPKTVKG